MLFSTREHPLGLSSSLLVTTVGVGVGVGVGFGVGVGTTGGSGNTACTAASASTLPKPNILSGPGAPRSTAFCFNKLVI